MQLSKKFWVVTSCKGRPTAEVFAKYYDLHYQQKKMKKDESNEVLNTQFRCITFHPNQYGGQAKLTPVVKNKWSGGWRAAGFIAGFPSTRAKLAARGYIYCTLR
jgi:hypothetical protein